jgi:hypothetical protein
MNRNKMLESQALTTLALHVRKLMVITNDRPATERLMECAQALDSRASEIREAAIRERGEI